MHCLTLTDNSLVLVDQEFAPRVAPLVDELRRKGVGPVYSYEPVHHLSSEVTRAIKEIGNPNVDAQLISDVDNGVGVETLGHHDDGMIYFTSGWV